MLKVGNVMATQTVNGKAFEYACLNSVAKKYENKSLIIREENDAYKTAEKHFYSLNEEHQRILSDGASKGIDIIERLEANLVDSNAEDTLKLFIQSDSKGMYGDVRDIVIKKNEKWEIGISAKHNHEAVKHSRLSQSIDFGAKWMNIPCSSNYFEEIGKVFNLLEIHNGTLWSESNIDKVEQVYKPLLNAFKKELLSIFGKHGGIVPCKLVEYLLGEYDFYKFVLDIKKEIIKINAYNLKGTLNKNTKNVKSDFTISKINLPDRIFHLDYILKDNCESDNTLELICNNGWQFSFRIHNASSKIEPSMKFDIQLIGVPTDIPSFIGIF